MYISYLLAIYKVADEIICRVVEMNTIAEITPNQTNVLNQMKTDFQPAYKPPISNVVPIYYSYKLRFTENKINPGLRRRIEVCIWSIRD